MCLLLLCSSDVRSKLALTLIYLGEITFVMKISNKSGILFSTVGQYVGLPVDMME
jgi:hypothetical protein